MVTKVIKHANQVSTAHKNAENRLLALYSTTKILSEASNLEDAAKKILQSICESLDWDFASIWVVDFKKRHLTCVATWYQHSLNAKSFSQITHRIKFKPGIGLPGRVWIAQKPMWVSDVIHDNNFPRAPNAKAAGLHSAFCFPIVLQNKILGMIEIFSRKSLTPDKPLLNMMSAIGPQIGQFIHRTLTEDQLQKSEAQKSAILESAKDSIITLSKDGIIKSFNNHTATMFKYKKPELLNKSINKLIDGLSEKMVELDSKLPIEFLGIRKNAETFYVEITISKMNMITDDGYVLIVRDINERKANENLKSDFISVVSHELKTPLSSIKGSIGLLLSSEEKLSSYSKELLEIADTNCERLVLIINDILDFEKLEAGKMTFNFGEVDIAMLINDAVKMNEIYAKKFNIHIKILNIKPAYVLGDYDRLIQVITNLLSNAIKFSPENSQVIISTSLIKGYVRVAVEDRGAGIPKEFRTKIFTKFTQVRTATTRKVGGTGLGLNICKTIVEKHHGKINFKSRAGHGCIFYFDLPRLTRKKNGSEQNPEHF